MPSLSTVEFHPPTALPRRAPRLARALLPLLSLALFLLVTLAPFLAPGVARADPAELAAVRFGHQGRFTRVVLELDRQVPIEVRLEREPARLLVELPELRLGLREDPLGRPRGLATILRPIATGSTGSRVTVELAGPAELVARFWIPPGQHSSAFRFVIDLEPEGASRPPGVATSRPESDPPLPRPRPPRLGSDRPATAAASGPSPAPAAATPPPPVVAAATAEKAAAAAPANGLAHPSGRIVVAIDPGHGGSDPGTIGVDGVKEKDLVLAMGLELAQALEATGRYGVVLTRRTDEGLALRERIKVAREGGAQLFLSLHADSLADPTVAGASVYTLSETASDEEAAALAAKENKADILSGTDLSLHDPIVASILIDLAQRDTLNKSIGLAQLLAEELRKVTPLLRNHRRYGGFAVLKSPETPSVLIELGYLSNPEEAKRLADPRHRRRLAQAIVAAIDRHTAAAERASGFADRRH